jgi:hypothetical protein
MLSAFSQLFNFSSSENGLNRTMNYQRLWFLMNGANYGGYFIPSHMNVVLRQPERRRMRLIGYLWALPVTIVGLLLGLGALFSGGSFRWRNGIVEVAGGMVAFLLRGNRFWQGGAAMAFGHVILARDAKCLEKSRSHELGHVRQFEKWGLLLFPVYWLISAWLWWRGYHFYLDHPFEPPPR